MGKITPGRKIFSNYRLLLLEYVSAVGSGEPVQTATFNLELMAIDHIAICAGGETGGYIHEACEVGDIDDCCAFLATVNNEYVAILCGLNVLFLTLHGLTELIYGGYFGMEEFIVSAFAEKIVAPVVLAGGVHRTAEEEGDTVLAGGKESPAGADLIVGERCAFVGVAVGVVAFNP